MLQAIKSPQSFYTLNPESVLDSDTIVDKMKMKIFSQIKILNFKSQIKIPNLENQIKIPNFK